MFFIPQTAVSTSFRLQIPAISQIWKFSHVWKFFKCLCWFHHWVNISKKEDGIIFNRKLNKANDNWVYLILEFFSLFQKKPPRSVLGKSCSENLQQIYRRSPMPKCDFNKAASNFIEITLWHGCSPVNLLHNFRTPFTKNTSGWLLLLFFIRVNKTSVTKIKRYAEIGSFLASCSV